MAAEFETRRGRIRPLAIVCISVLATLAVVFSGLPTPAQLMFLPVIAFSAHRALARHSTRSIRIERSAAASLDGERGTLVGEAVTGLFVALKLTAVDRKVRRAFIFRDELEPEAFRELLAYLRHG